MIALLGDFDGRVQVEGSSILVYIRTSVYDGIGELPASSRVVVGMAENHEAVVPVYDLPVVVFDGKIIREAVGYGRTK